MKHIHFLAGIAGITLCAGTARAQLALNEIYISHTNPSADTFEFIEIKGPALASLAGHMVLIVEGDGALAGTLDRVYDLNAASIPASGFFVISNIGGTPGDFSTGVAQDAFENGTDTFYLVQTTNQAQIQGLLGTSIATGASSTSIPSLATIIDSVGVADAGISSGDIVWDNALVTGPDGTFLPGGIFRCGDAPNTWAAAFLDFDAGANANQPRTPGAANGTSCTGVGGTGGTPFCFGDGTLATACPCANTGGTGRGCANSQLGSTGALLTVSGITNPDTITLNASAMLPTATNIYLQGSSTAPTGVVFGDGVRCAAGQLLRLAVKTAVGGASQYPDPGVGDLSITAKAAALGFPNVSGATYAYQTYYRDADLAFCAAPTGNSWNVTNGILVTWP